MDHLLVFILQFSFPLELMQLVPWAPGALQAPDKQVNLALGLLYQVASKALVHTLIFTSS